MHWYLSRRTSDRPVGNNEDTPSCMWSPGSYTADNWRTSPKRRAMRPGCRNSLLVPFQLWSLWWPCPGLFCQPADHPNAFNFLNSVNIRLRKGCLARVLNSLQKKCFSYKDFARILQNLAKILQNLEKNLARSCKTITNLHDNFLKFYLINKVFNDMIYYKNCKDREHYHWLKRVKVRSLPL